MLIRIRAEFVRGEEVKYISHLDLMKTFERAIRRSKIPIAYSQGFNPHPRMVFGLPMAVGVTSDSEYLDVDLEENISAQDFVELLNSQLPKGLRLTCAKKKESRTNIMATIVMAHYEVTVKTAGNVEIDMLHQAIKRLIERPEILVVREGKKGRREINIRPMIHKIDIATAVNEDMEKVFVFSSLLSAGSAANLNPELLVKAIEEEIETKIDILKIHRTQLLVKGPDGPINPLDDSVLVEDEKTV